MKEMKDSSLIQVSLLYKSNEDAGITINLRKTQIEDKERIVLISLTEYIEKWNILETKFSSKLTADMMFKELDELAATKHDFKNEKLFDLIGLIWILVEKKFLPINDYNRCIFIYN